MNVRLTDADRRRIVRWYQHGDPIRTIAARVGAAYGTVHRVLIQNDVPMRPRGGARSR